LGKTCLNQTLLEPAQTLLNLPLTFVNPHSTCLNPPQFVLNPGPRAPPNFQDGRQDRPTRAPGEGLGPSWGALGLFWESLGPLLGVLGPSLGGLWGLLGSLEGVLGCSWELLDPLGSVLAAHEAINGSFWLVLECRSLILFIDPKY